MNQSMKVWAFNQPTDNGEQDAHDFISQSLKNGISRFGWSYFDTADLTKLKNKSWHDMTKNEQECWKKTNFLLEIREGDWIVHINVPKWGHCSAGQVIKEYSFDTESNEMGDYKHMIKIDPKTVIEFDRNNENVLPSISNKLKLRGRYWRIYDEDDFFKTIKNLKENAVSIKGSESIGVYYLKKAIVPALKEITVKIQHTHPKDKLELLIANVFRKIPNVIDVIENGKGKGWGTDYGADVIVKYKAGLQVSTLEKDELLVVQVKSYTNIHWETNAVDQIETAINEFDANAGLIISTAESSEKLEQAIEMLTIKLDKPVVLLAGENVAKFILKYGSDLIFND